MIQAVFVNRAKKIPVEISKKKEANYDPQKSCQSVLSENQSTPKVVNLLNRKNSTPPQARRGTAKRRGNRKRASSCVKKSAPGSAPGRSVRNHNTDSLCGYISKKQGNLRFCCIRSCASSQCAIMHRVVCACCVGVGCAAQMSVLIWTQFSTEARALRTAVFGAHASAPRPMPPAHCPRPRFSGALHRTTPRCPGVVSMPPWLRLAQRMAARRHGEAVAL